MSGEGLVRIQALADAGFTADEISDWKQTTSQTLFDAGFSEKETSDYFGVKEPDMSKVKDTFKNNFAKNKKEEKPQGERVEAKAGEPNGQPGVEVADTFMEALEAGWDMSVSGLISERPDVVLPKDAPMYMRIASGLSTLAGDVPAMTAGAFGGLIAGSAAGTAALPVVGTVGLGAAGAAAGAFALPEGIRTAMMEHYEKGDIESFQDFWERSSAVFIESLKAGVVGAATAGIGGAVGKVAAKTALPAIAKTTAAVTSEVATMTTVGAALDGRVPEPSEFLDGAILVGGLRGAVKAASKMRKIYGKTGLPAAEVVEAAAKDPHIKQQLLAENIELPKGISTITGEFSVIRPPEPGATIIASKPVKSKPLEHSTEINTILAKVGEQPTKKAKLPDADKLYTDFVDKLHPVNQAVKILNKNKEFLPASENPYILTRMANDAKAKAKHFFEKGSLDFNTLEVKGKPLIETLNGVENLDVLRSYLISRRVVEKSGQGIKTGFDVEAAKKVVNQNKAKYDKAAKEFTEFNNQVLEYVSESGIISKTDIAKIKELNKNYVSFKRIIEVSDEVGAKKPGGKKGSLKKLKGSEKDIQDPIQSVLDNTVEMIQAAENNRPLTQLIKLAEKSEGQELIKKVETPSTPVKIGEKQVAAELKKLGVDPEAAKPITTFTKQKRNLTPNQFEVFRDGKREVYETTPELAKAIQTLGGDSGSTSTLFKLMRGLTTFKRFSITFTPDFLVKNLIRDKVTAGVFSKSKNISITDIAGAMGDLIKKNDVYFNWLKAGGANGAFLELNKAYLSKDIRGLQKQTGFLNSARNVIEKPIDIMRIAGTLSEQSIRLAEFKKVTKGRKGLESLVEGGFASREITLDFQRVGAKISAMNSITAFLNVSIQGLDKTGRAFKADPKGAATKAFAYITAPSVLLWWANKDDQRVQEIPRWEKDNFWIIATDDWQKVDPSQAQGLPDYMVREENGNFQINKGVIYRVPKPMELGVLFGSLPERTLDLFFKDNPGSFKDFGETISNLTVPNFVPDAVAPAMEQFFNKSFFTGRDIIPHHLKDIMPEYQFVDYTSETAKVLGKMISSVGIFRDKSVSSPMVIDNYIRSWSGALGQYAIQVADKALQKTGVAPDITEPSATLKDVPFIKSFVVRFPRSGSASVQDFYGQYDKSKVLFNTIRHLARQGDLENLEKEVFLKRNQGNMIKLDGIKDSLSNQSKMVRLINKNPDMSSDEKRQMIDSLYLMMIETSKAGNEIMEGFRKGVKEE